MTATRAGRWEEPARPRRTGLTAQQQELADLLRERALELRAGSEDGMSIREAVDLAAVQLGLQPPQNDTEGNGDR